MPVFRINTLQRRLVIFLMIPVTLILLVAGITGFFYVRKALLAQWQEKAILQLERAAHHIDMRLGFPMELIDMFNQSGLLNDRRVSREWILRHLNSVEGVSSVTLQMLAPEGKPNRRMRMLGYSSSQERDRGMMGFHQGVFNKITAPRFDTSLGFETVNLVSSLLDESGKPVGRLEVSIRFDYLISGIISLGWWQSHKAGIVNDTGDYLVHTKASSEPDNNLGDSQDPVAAELKKRLGEISGTLLGPRHPAESVAGFYRLTKAPWTIVMFVSGEKILEPIIRFRNYFFLGWGLVSLLTLIVIRRNVSRIAGPIRLLSKAAEKVAAGNYGPAVHTKSDDEIGQLARSYNRMVEGLKERDLIQSTFGRYVDPKVARKLLSRPEFTRMGGFKSEVVILMSDIRGFTAMSEKMNPDAVIRILNHYFSHMIETTHKHEGIIVDFIGDGLLVFFEPMEETRQQVACRAYECARKMMTGMHNVNDILAREDLPQLDVGIGLNAGEVVIGNIGSDKRTKYGIVGAEVNLTQRVQSKAQAGEIIVTSALYKNMDCDPQVTRTFSTQVKGVSESVQLYSVI